MLVIEHAHDMDAASAALLGAVLEALPEHPWLVLTTRRDAPGGFAAAPGPGRHRAARSSRWQPADALDARRAADGGRRRCRPPCSRGPRSARPATRSSCATCSPAPPPASDGAHARRSRRRRPRGSTGSTRTTATLVRRAAVLGMSFHPRDAGRRARRRAAARRRHLGAARRRVRRRRRRLVRFRIGVLRDAAYAGPAVPHAPAAARRRRARGWSASSAPRAGERAARALAALLPRRRPRRAPGATRARRASARARRARTPTRPGCSRARVDAARGAGAGRPSSPTRWVALGEALRAQRPPGRRAGRATGAPGGSWPATRVRARRGAAAPDRARRPRRRRAPQAVRGGLRALRTLDGRPGRRGRRAAARGCSPRVAHDAPAPGPLRRTRSRSARQAIAEGEAAGEDRAVAHACHLLDWALHDAGRGAEATHSARALAIYERLGDLDRQAAVLNNLGAFAFHAGDWREAVVLYRRAGNASAQAGDVGQRRVRRLQRRRGAGRAGPAHRRRRGAAARDAGLARLGLRLGRRLRAPRCSAAPRSTRGAARTAAGCIQRALAKLRRLGHEPEAQMAEALLAEALVFGGHAERALQELEALAPAAARRAARAAARPAARLRARPARRARPPRPRRSTRVARARARDRRRTTTSPPRSTRSPRCARDDPRAPGWRRERAGDPRAARRRPPRRAAAVARPLARLSALAAHLRVDRAAGQPRDDRDAVAQQPPLLHARRRRW